MNTKMSNRPVIVRLTAKEHLYHLAGIKKGISDGLEMAANQLETAADQYVKSYEEAAKNGDPKYTEALPAVKQQAEQYREVAKQLIGAREKYSTEANQLLDRAHNSAEPLSLRNRMKRVIISAMGAWKEG